MRVVLQPAARADLHSILDYLEEQSSSLSIRRRFLLAFEATCFVLVTYPHIGQVEPVMDPAETGGFPVRRIVLRRFRNYLVFYMPTDSEIRILRVLHGARHPEHRLGAPFPNA